MWIHPIYIATDRSQSPVFVKFLQVLRLSELSESVSLPVCYLDKKEQQIFAT